MKNKKPLVSVLIPAYNEEKVIADCLNSLKKQTYKNSEIIVIDDGSTDNTKVVAGKFKGVKILRGPHKGPGNARNLGAKYAKGEILILVDADMVFDKDYINKLTAPIIAGKSFGTEERFQKAMNLDNKWSRCWGVYTIGYPKSAKKGNVFRAIKKSEFIRLGGFDSKYGYSDDMTFYHKYGVMSDLVAGAVCWHRNPETLKEVYRQSIWIGSSLKTYNPVLRVPGLNLLLSLLICPLGIIIIPIYAIKKTLKNNMYKDFFNLLVFYSVRFVGTMYGVIREILTKRNVR